MELHTAENARTSLYSVEERQRRDTTPWTWVQAVLAPLQFLAFAVSLLLILRYLANGEGAFAAAVSVLVKTGLLYAIMITGACWEKAVFGRWLFAPVFFWEDVVSMAVIALHTLYVVLWARGAPLALQFGVALLAYLSYLVNAAQFLRKFALARRGLPAGAAA
jgi:3-vinyl bacteriochlorophyllide hydratase